MTSRLPARIGRRNAAFQQLEALLRSRRKRSSAGEMIIQGVRPLSRAVEAGHPLRALLVDETAELSSWAERTIAAAGAPVTRMAAELMAELGEREDGAPELLALAEIPAGDVSALDPAEQGAVLVLDRPSSPGNIGTAARTADALGMDALVISGHAADPWDPQAIRASVGSLFALPPVRIESHRELAAWLEDARSAGTPWTVVGLDEAGGHELSATDLRGPVMIVVGNETVGMSGGWRETCDLQAEIPMLGGPSSLNAAVAGSIAMYELRRQRGR